MAKLIQHGTTRPQSTVSVLPHCWLGSGKSTKHEKSTLASVLHGDLWMGPGLM